MKCIYEPFNNNYNPYRIMFSAVNPTNNHMFSIAHVVFMCSSPRTVLNPVIDKCPRFC